MIPNIMIITTIVTGNIDWTVHASPCFVHWVSSVNYKTMETHFFRFWRLGAPARHWCGWVLAKALIRIADLAQKRELHVLSFFFSLSRHIFVILIYVLCMCEYQRCADALTGQKKDTKYPGTRVAGYCLIQMLALELWSSARAVWATNSWAISTVLKQYSPIRGGGGGCILMR